jgi:very-short-patch-repair endonuclease
MALSPDILRNARELRSTLTDAENLLWLLLRDRRFCGCKFRRQHPVGGYILDFYCHEAKLAIELDGGGHAGDEQVAYDEVRTKVIEGAGITVLRFWNSEVLRNIEVVLESIHAALFPSPGLRPPSPGGRGDECVSCKGRDVGHIFPSGKMYGRVPSPSGRRCPEGADEGSSGKGGKKE